MFTEYNPSGDDLIHLLSVSVKLEFRRVRILAIRKIELLPYEPPLDPVSRILLAQQYDLGSWFGPCCENLAFRAHGLTFQEANLLGVEMTNCVWAIREDYRTSILQAGASLDFPLMPISLPGAELADGTTSLVPAEHEQTGGEASNTPVDEFLVVTKGRCVFCTRLVFGASSSMT
jgi:hypothetical protein